MRLFPDTKTKLQFLAVITLAAALVVPSVSAQTVDNLKDQQNQLQQKLSQIQNQINGFQQQIATTQKQQNTLKNQVSIFDNQISSLELQIQANQTQTDDLNLQITEIKDQITRREAEIADNKKILGQLIVQLNEMDSNSLLYMGLGNDNFSTFLDQVQYTESVQGKVYQILQNVKSIEAKLQEQQTELEGQLAHLQDLRDQLDQTQSSLADQKKQKQGLLDQTRGLERNYQKLLGQSQGQEDQLQKEISDLDSAIRAKLGNLPVPIAKGSLAYPINGILTQGYGNTGFTALGYSFHNGIDLAAPPGTPIYAAADGVVVACDTGEAVYGNWCAIKHTLSTSAGIRQIVTLYAHMRSFKLHGGQTVKQGDLVGYEGNTGNTTRLIRGEGYGYHLHFGVYDAKGFTIAPGAYTNIYGPYTVPGGITYNPFDFLNKK